MLKSSIAAVLISLSLGACSVLSTKQNFDKPQNLLFTNKEINTLPLHIQRDDRLCEDDKLDNQKCPIKLYIDDFKAGDFYVNNTVTYYLKPNEYELTVKNCKEECKTYHTKITISEQLHNVNLVLSVDHEGKPFIINKKS